jgi:hypothetical protein
MVKKLMLPDQLLSTELCDIIVRLANLRAAMASRVPPNSDSSVPILQQLDSDLENWASGLPSYWSYELCTSDTPSKTYTPYLCYHKYSGFSIATVWNQYRVARCLVNAQLLSYMESSPAAYTSSLPSTIFKQSERVKEIIRNTCTDICASVPYFFRQTNQNNTQNPGIGAMEVMWALFICADMQCVPEMQRLWAIQQLERIGYRMWIAQALAFADLAKSKITPVKQRGTESAG